MLFWGTFAPIFGIIADKLGGNKAVFIGFVIFGLGVYMLMQDLILNFFRSVLVF